MFALSGTTPLMTRSSVLNCPLSESVMSFASGARTSALWSAQFAST